MRLVDTVMDCLEIQTREAWADVHLDFDAEKQLSLELAAHWRINLTTPTLSSLKQKLAARVVDIWRFGRQETLAGSTGRNERFIANEALNFDFVEEMLYAIGLINDFSKKKNRQWALLFDELEIAPNWLVDKLYPLLRSTTTQNVYFKLSMSPFAKISQANLSSSPRPSHDYELVHLWYIQKSEAIPFSRELLVKTLERRCNCEIDLHKIFGPSPLKPSTKERDSGYGVGSRAHEVLSRAYANDPGFQEYVNRKDINLNELDKLDEDTRAADIRKVYPIVLFRQEFLKDEGSFRSRKKPQIFSGIDSFLEILEGNPRWIVGAANELAVTIQNKKRITPSIQYTYLRETAERFMSLLKTIPLYDGGRDQKSLGDALDHVGDRIYESIMQERFTSEPYGSFRVDEKCPDDLLDSIGIAMNAGAVILLSDVESNWLVARELRGKEFRMSYLFSPYKHIPFRIGRAFPLSDVLNGVGKQRSRVATRDDEFNFDQ